MPGKLKKAQCLGHRAMQEHSMVQQCHRKPLGRGSMGRRWMCGNVFMEKIEVEGLLIFASGGIEPQFHNGFARNRKFQRTNFNSQYESSLLDFQKSLPNGIGQTLPLLLTTPPTPFSAAIVGNRNLRLTSPRSTFGSADLGGAVCPVAFVSYCLDGPKKGTQKCLSASQILTIKVSRHESPASCLV